ncbi:hypothetical protein Ga0074812_14849 [Parafrankia irregularis]|uniref:Uncharacterized protein n=1 Tax=Parafrankia irregularis TaxID=795642 RepID=A0A0S4QYX8_9ACTN|nr:hypothetical protein Ga0074812_14849 [Parafrankia irregularis]
MDITISGLTRPQAHTLLRLTTTLLTADGPSATLTRRQLHPATLRVLVDRGLAWTYERTAGPTEAGLATVTEALRPLLTGRLDRVQAVADRTWLPQTVGISLHPVYGEWDVEIRSLAMATPVGTYGPYLTVLPTRYHRR